MLVSKDASQYKANANFSLHIVRAVRELSAALVSDGVLVYRCSATRPW